MKPIILLFLSICYLVNLHMPRVAAQREVRQQITLIDNYVVYYGLGRAADLARYDLAIVQPDTLTKSELGDLRAKGTLVVVYLSIGEANPASPWATNGRIEPGWILGKNEQWGSNYIDANQPGWHQLITSLVDEFTTNGYDGVFIDNVDTAAIFPETRPGMVALIHSLRRLRPDSLLIQNRGFAFLDRVVSDLDAVVFESFSTSYDFDTQQYIYVDNTSFAWELGLLHQRTGLPILALDYVAPCNTWMAQTARQTAQYYGFISFVSVIQLNDIPNYESCAQ